VKVAIDAARCQGHGRCLALAPALFDIGESGYGEVVGDGQIPRVEADAARLAALNCPEGAISLVE
jgi:ferredoxin